MGRSRTLIPSALPLRSLIALTAAALAVSACTLGGESERSTTTSSSLGGATTTSTGLEAPPTTGVVTTPTTALRRVDDPALGVVVTFQHRIEIRPTEGEPITVLGDEARALRVAYDDLNGGVVYQYRATPSEFGPDAILHLPRGSGAPVVLLNATGDERIELVDVGLLDGLVTIVALARDERATRLLGLPLAGGAAAELLRIGPAGVEPPADNEFLYQEILSGSVGGGLIGHLIKSNATCQFAEARRSDGRFLVDPLLTACDAGRATLADLNADGMLLAYVVEAADDALLRGIDLERFAPTGTPTIELGAIHLDLIDSTAVITYPDGYLLSDFEATRFVEVENPRAVTALRSVPTLAIDAFLGGFRAPDTCSGTSVGAASLQSVPDPVQGMRNSISAAVRACDFRGLVDLAGPAFLASLDGVPALDLWAEQESRGLTPLADIARILDLPFAVVENPGSDTYVWPSAFGDAPTEEDWIVLEMLYNEEEIELWRADGYVGLRVGISEAGEWLFAVTGD